MTTRYISCACNTSPHSVDWGTNGLICYGACHAVVIYDPNASKTGKVLFTFSEQTGTVFKVQWIQTINNEPELEFISASSDNTVIIWSKVNDGFIPTSTIKETNVLTIATARYVCKEDQVETSKRNLCIVCTGNINGQFKIWQRDTAGDISCIQTIEFGRKLPIEATLWFLPSTKIPCIAIAMDDSTIQLFSQNLNHSDVMYFIHVQNLIGHEDWVRCLDFTNDDIGDVLLASGSQDNVIRLWRLYLDDEEVIGDTLRQKKLQFSVNSRTYNVAVESVLLSHEGWIFGVNWHPPIFTGETRHQPMKLLSCSLDKTMIVWEPNPATGIWLEYVRVGEVGGNSLGFYGCKFGPDGKSLMAHGYQGSFHIWEEMPENRNWTPRSAPSGHYSAVSDLCWDLQGRFLMTTGLDQTTRIHAPWEQEFENTWHEIGRPQVHGHNIFCLAMLTPYMFASGAEEKVIRTFTAPATFVNYLKKISNANDCSDFTPESASVPALGLSNKALFEGQISSGENLYTRNAKDLNFDKPPTEEELLQHTLWPELQKLYGHGYEIFAIAVKPGGALLASACKSSSVEHSAIILWDTKEWKLLQKLVFHQLTVTQLAFSPNGIYLLSVSRDRRWALFIRNENGYDLIATSAKDTFHRRIIWCCAWTDDSKYFATGSRDGKVGIWNPTALALNEKSPVASLQLKDMSITSLAFSQLSRIPNSYLLAIGLETGNIEIHKVIIEEHAPVWRKFQSLDRSIAHHLTVKRLSFRPRFEIAKRNIIQLASCGLDHMVKIYEFDLQELEQF